jgi:hypothetical protein
MSFEMNNRFEAGLVRFFRWAPAALILLSAILAPGRESTRTTTHGLVVRGGKVLLDGRPFEGVGANYFSLFSRLLADPNDNSSLSNLAALAQADIPFVRFMCGGYWPSEQRLYLEHSGAFFQSLDRVVRAAEESRVGLVPSLFWHLSTVVDLAGEPMQALGNSESKSIALIRHYTEDVVNRYKNSPAIWAWEFGNESALSADLPNAREQRPPIVPELGTPISRSEHDDLSSIQLHVAYQAFAETVHRLDPARIVMSGNALPRSSAWHNTHEKNWTTDTVKQFQEILAQDNPDPMAVISAHIYHSPAYPGDAAGIEEIVALAAESARKAGKPLFLGEFGAERQLGSSEQQKIIFAQFLAAIEKNHVPLSAFWVFDLPAMENDWNVSFKNDRSYMLDLVSQANARLRQRR